MLNMDVIDLYDKVTVGTKVVVIAPPREPSRVASAKTQKRQTVAKKPKPSIASLERFDARLAGNTRKAVKKKAFKMPIVRKTNFNLKKSTLALR